MRKKYSDKFFRLIDPHQNITWHWLLSTGKSSGILCGIRKAKFDIIKVEEKEFLVEVEVYDKSLRKNLSLVMVYGPAHKDRRDIFYLNWLKHVQKSKSPPRLEGILTF
jgi:hypothetical protein